MEKTADNAAYFHFTGPSRLDKAVSTLEGILRGIHADGTINPKEIGAIQLWVNEHKPLARRHPFSEIMGPLTDALADKKLDAEEVADLIWLCERLNPERGFYDDVTSAMQTLQGMLGGIIADGVVNDAELTQLSAWMEEHEILRGRWPFDEIESLIVEVKKDGVIDNRERQMLKLFFGEFSTVVGRKSLGMPLNETNLPIGGLCAVCPEVTVTERTFCFTGASKKASRTKFKQIVHQHGGTFIANVTKELNYLVIGADGNPCWAYACYGRKVEQAVNLRKVGHPVVIVHEADFWDAIA